jgi:hypothetical protein
VIAVEYVNRPTSVFRFLLESLEESDHGVLLVAPVEDVAGLDYDEIASDPLVACVDGPSEAQGQSGGLQVAVQVSDGDDALGGPKPCGERLLDRDGLPVRAAVIWRQCIDESLKGLVIRISAIERTTRWSGRRRPRGRASAM